MGVALALATILALGGIGIYTVLKAMQNFQPGRKKIQKDLQQIRADLKPVIAELVPWSREEMEQLSFNQVKRTSRKRVITSAQGVFTTIYHEPVIAWAYKKYVSPKENALLYIRTSRNEFIYRIKNEEVEVVIDDQLVGKIDAAGRLFNYKGTKQLAQINRQSEELLLPVTLGEKEIGSLINPARTNKSNPRAFQLLSSMEKAEEEIFLSLAVLEMVRRNL
jgi:hypothetical protein